MCVNIKFLYDYSIFRYDFYKFSCVLKISMQKLNFRFYIKITRVKLSILFYAKLKYHIIGILNFNMLQANYQYFCMKF